MWKSISKWVIIGTGDETIGIHHRHMDCPTEEALIRKPGPAWGLGGTILHCRCPVLSVMAPEEIRTSAMIAKAVRQ
ncbi:MAG: hypothetical protein ACYC1F_05505, partial [Gallionellaceae bacterium]